MRHKKDSSTEKANAKKRTSKLVNIQRYHIATYWSIYDLLINEISWKISIYFDGDIFIGNARYDKISKNI